MKTANKIMMTATFGIIFTASVFAQGSSSTEWIRMSIERDLNHEPATVSETTVQMAEQDPLPKIFRQALLNNSTRYQIVTSAKSVK